MNAAFWDWVQMPTEVFVGRRIPRKTVASRRRSMTGHTRPISEKWCPAIGAWGAIRTLEEIACDVRVSAEEVKNYANAHRLKYATKRRRSTHATLAVRLWLDRAVDARESCRRHGVLPVERVLLCGALQAILDDQQWTIREVLRMGAADLEQVWHCYGFEFTPPKLSLEQLFERIDAVRQYSPFVRAGAVER